MEAAQRGAEMGVVERLRRQIERLQAQPRALVLALRTGISELDALGCFRLGAGVALTGDEASGRTSVALSVVAAAGRERRLAAWVDGPRELYPPAAPGLGVQLERLLIVRPRPPGKLVWAAVQLLRSGAFACVVLDLTHTGVRPSPAEAKKLLDAARVGGALLLLLGTEVAAAPGLVRLELRATGAEPRAPPLISLSTPHGRSLHLSRAQLSARAPPPGRCRERPEEAPWVPRVCQGPPAPDKRRSSGWHGHGFFYRMTPRLPAQRRG